MEKVLNQEEIDAMFRAARQGKSAGKPQVPKVLPCNFRQAGQISSDHVRSISALHEVFARNLAHWMAAYLRTAFDCNLVSVEQIPYREVVSRIPDLAYLASLRLNPMEAIGALQLDLSLAFPIIDVLLGGQGASEQQKRDVTEIEEEILQGVVKIMCRGLETAWQPIGLEFVFGQRQQPSQMQRLMPPNEMTLSLSFEIRMSEARGTLNLILPAVVSNALLRKLARDWAYQKPQGTADANSHIRARLMHCAFPVELGLTAVPVRVADLLALQPGNLLPLRRPVGTSASILAGGRELFAANAVRQGNMIAAQVRERIVGRNEKLRNATHA